MKTAKEFAEKLYEVGTPIVQQAAAVDAAFEAIEVARANAQALARAFKKEVRKLWTQKEISTALGGQAHRGCPHNRA